MKIYVSTANQYLHLIKPFYYLFNLFWNPKEADNHVTVIGYDRPKFELPKNFNFVSMGRQEGGIKQWSTDLRKFFSSIDDEFFMYTVEDHFLTYPVDFHILNKFKSLLNHKVGRIGLTNDMPNKAFDIIEDCHTYNIIERRQDQEYRLSLLWGIWNREYLLRYLEPGLDPHDFEIVAGRKAMNDGWRILGSFGNYCMHHCQGIRKGNLNGELGFKFINDSRILDPNIIEDMKRNGII